MKHHLWRLLLLLALLPSAWTRLYNCTVYITEMEWNFIFKKFRYYKKNVLPEPYGQQTKPLVNLECHVERTWWTDGDLHFRLLVQTSWFDGRLNLTGLRDRQDITLPDALAVWTPDVNIDPLKETNSFNMLMADNRVVQKRWLEGPLRCIVNRDQEPFETITCWARLDFETTIDLRLTDSSWNTAPAASTQYSGITPNITIKQDTWVVLKINMRRSLMNFVVYVFIPSLAATLLIFTSIFIRRRNQRTMLSCTGFVALVFMWYRQSSQHGFCPLDTWFVGCITVELFLLVDLLVVANIERHKLVYRTTGGGAGGSGSTTGVGGASGGHKLIKSPSSLSRSVPAIDARHINGSRVLMEVLHAESQPELSSTSSPAKKAIRFKTSDSRSSVQSGSSQGSGSGLTSGYFYRNVAGSGMGATGSSAWRPSKRTLIRHFVRALAVIYFVFFVACYFISYLTM